MVAPPWCCRGGDLTASFFGKVCREDNPREGVSDADVARALVIMITQNISQIAFLNARACGSERVIFTGNFLRHNEIAKWKETIAPWQADVLIYDVEGWTDMEHCEIVLLCRFVALSSSLTLNVSPLQTTNMPKPRHRR